LAQRPTRNVAAYDAFLRGEKLSQSGTLSDAVPLRKAIGFYKQAVAEDDKFVEAWAELSRSACGIATSSPNPEDLQTCKEGAERAVQLAPDTPEARLAMGHYHRLITRDYDRALEQFRLGLERNPNHALLLAGSAQVERNLG